MLGSIAKALFGSSNERYVASLGSIVAKINGFETTISAMTDEELAHQTVKFRERLADGEKLDDLLPEAFATVREASKRALGQRHYDVQMVGGIVLHRGEIAEMRTGEGKTLVATLACLSERAAGQGRPRRHRQRLPRPPRRRMDGADLQVPRHDRRRDRPQPQRARAARRLRRRTSPTAPTTSSASTICATT